MWQKKNHRTINNKKYQYVERVLFRNMTPNYWKGDSKEQILLNVPSTIARAELYFVAGTAVQLIHFEFKFSDPCFKPDQSHDTKLVKYTQWNGTSNEIVCGDGKIQGYEECDCGVSTKNCICKINTTSQHLKNISFPCRLIPQEFDIFYFVRVFAYISYLVQI